MLAVFVFAFAALVHAKPVHAAVNTGIQYLTSTGLTTTDIRTFVSRIIRYFLGLLGIIAVSLIIYAGFLYMTAAGSEEKIKKAKAIMVNAVIGLTIIMAAYAIVAWILGAVSGIGGGGGAGGNGPQGFGIGGGNRGSSLGNGIIQYHYPEPGQTDVPRNTKISITFKKPLVLSSIFKGYDDKGTYDPADDVLCNAGEKPPTCTGAAVTSTTPLQLNSDNIKIIPNDSLADAGTGSFDDQFNNRYPDAGALVNPPPAAKVTAVTMPFSAPQTQTIVMKPVAPIGSPTSNMNYRVALRGGDTGVKVWDETNDPTKPAVIDAFSNMTADGAYFWSFTTSTLIDNTPPRVVAVIPDTTIVPGTPSDTVLDRNQLLQIYFSEAVDPTTASGQLGTGGGFNNIDIVAQCLPGTFGTGDCVFNGGNPGTIDGTLTLGNRYRTAEFQPSAACENITENSCGETVYCLPKNVKLTVVAKAAQLDLLGKNPEPPASAVDNGVEDMAANSFDGNNNGVAEGPQATPDGTQPGGKPFVYYLNNPQNPLDGVSDTSKWDYVVGSNVDLTVPQLRAIDPPTGPVYSDLYTAGPSNVPVTTAPAFTFSKTMSIGSMRTGSYDDQAGDYTDPYSTVVFRAYECAKASTAACAPGVPCPCNRMGPPGFFLGGQATDNPPFSSLVLDPGGSGKKVTRIALLHPTAPFFTANDLGYTEQDIINSPVNIPTYVPVARAKIKDTKQNCFYPSVYKPTIAGPECTLAGVGMNSCCNKGGINDSQFKAFCFPPVP